MKRTVQLGKSGNNIPAAKGKQKNKHRLHELQLQRQAIIDSPEDRAIMKKDFEAQIYKENSDG